MYNKSILSNNNLLYESTLTNSYILFEIKDNNAIINDIYIFQDDIKLYLLLLKSVFHDLENKENIKNIIQNVSLDDYNLIFKNDWHLLLKDNYYEICSVSIEIENALELMSKAFGMGDF
jgi:hypothetical protein